MEHPGTDTHAGVMKTPKRRRLLKIGVPVAVCAAVMGGVLAFFGGRVEAVTCSLVTSTKILVKSAAESQITFSRDPLNALGDAAIRVNGTPCGTLKTIDVIDTQGSTGTEIVVIDQTNGRFVDPNDNSEIRFTGDLNTGNLDKLVVNGNSSAEDYTLGQDATGVRATLGKDALTEIVLKGVESVTADPKSGNDRVSGQGTNGTTLNVPALQVPITISTGTGADKAFGGGGNDTVNDNGGPSAATLDDVLDGGAGKDSISYATTTSPITVHADTGTVVGDAIGNDNLTSFELVQGGSGNDTYYENPVVCDDFTGNGGNDTFVALNRPGEACADGSFGDRFNAGAGTADRYDAFVVPANSPGVTFDFVNNIVHGSGEDACIGCESGNGSDAGGDTFIDDPNHCNFFNGNGDDDVFIAANRPGTEEGGTCGDAINGGAGDDTYDATGAPANSPGVTFDFVNNIVHGSGEDSCIDCENGKGTDQGDDTFLDDPNECNVFDGNNGDDLFHAVNRPGTEEGGTCGDTVNGGNGTDDYDATEVPANSPGVTFDFVNNIVHGSGEDHVTGLERGDGSAHADTFLDADDSCNIFRGNGGDDVFVAGLERPGQETDPVHGTCGDDVELGETDETTGDSLDYSRTLGPDGVTMDIPNGIVSGGGDDVGQNAENITGTEYADTLIGDSGNNTINGLGGNDTITTNGGNDTVDGGAGQDTIDGEPEQTEPPASIYCNLTTGERTVNGVTEHGVTECVGGAGDDTLIGNDANNEIHGGGGNDTIEGRGGDDHLYGEDGNDTLKGENGNDDLYGGNGNDNIDGGNGDDRVWGDAGNDTIFGGTRGVDQLHGGTGDDTIDGGSANDTIYGDEGDDTLIGNTGNDTLDGGTGEEDGGRTDRVEPGDFVDGGAGSDSCVNGESVANCES